MEVEKIVETYCDEMEPSFLVIQKKKRKTWNPKGFGMEIISSCVLPSTSQLVISDGQLNPWEEEEDDSEISTEQDIIEKALSRIGRGSLFTKVLGACAPLAIFWNKLKEIKYVQMLTCVCKGSRELLEPNGENLPFWGIWAPYMRPHLWNEIRCFMNVKGKHLKGLKDVSEKKNEFKSNSQRLYSVQGVLDFMVKIEGSVENYAKSIKKFRHFRKIAIKRRITFLLKNQENGNGCGPFSKKGGEKKVVQPTRETPETKSLREEQDLKDEFFTVFNTNWDTVLQMHDICQTYFPPSKYTPYQTCKAVRTMAVMHFCLSRHVPKIQDILLYSSNNMDQRRRMMRSQAKQLSNCIQVWFRNNGEAMNRVVLKTLERVGNLKDPRVNCIAFSDTSAYFPMMEVEVKRQEKVQSDPIPIPDIPKMLELMLNIQQSMNNVEENINDNMNQDNTGSQYQKEDDGDEDPMNLLHLLGGNNDVPTEDSLQIIVDDDEHAWMFPDNT